MKKLFFFFLFLTKICLAGEIGGDVMEEKEKTPVEQLQALVLEMNDLTDKLRADRTDESVQLQGKGIEDNLERLTKGMEQSQQQQQKKEQESEKQKQAKQRQQQLTTPMQNSVLKPPSPENHTPLPQESAQVIAEREKWSKLPKTQRDEILQVYKEEMPPRWQNRIAAYFLSIAKEEVEAEKEKRYHP